MKKLILSLLAVGGVTVAFAQGTVNFATINVGNTSLGQVFLPDGTTGPGSAFVGQLYWSDTSDGTFVGAGTPQAFSSLFPTYISDGTVTVTGRDPGVAVFFQLRVWNLAAGADWGTATANGSPNPVSNPLLTAYGLTQAKSRTLAGQDPSDPTILYPPQSFNNFPNLTLTVNVPEPTTIALAGLGVAALLAFRRRS